MDGESAEEKDWLKYTCRGETGGSQSEETGSRRGISFSPRAAQCL